MPISLKGALMTSAFRVTVELVCIGAATPVASATAISGAVCRSTLGEYIMSGEGASLANDSGGGTEVMPSDPKVLAGRRYGCGSGNWGCTKTGPVGPVGETGSVVGPVGPVGPLRPSGGTGGAAGPGGP